MSQIEKSGDDLKAAVKGNLLDDEKFSPLINDEHQ